MTRPPESAWPPGAVLALLALLAAHVALAVVAIGRLPADSPYNPVDVTAYEFSILRALAQRPGKVLSREQLLDLAKGSADLSFDRSIDVHVSRLRAKLGDDSRSPKILKTVRGVGYLLAGGD